MSVIVREPESEGGKIVLICKGADSIVFERMTDQSKKSSEFRET